MSSPQTPSTANPDDPTDKTTHAPTPSDLQSQPRCMGGNASEWCALAPKYRHAHGGGSSRFSYDTLTAPRHLRSSFRYFALAQERPI